MTGGTAKPKDAAATGAWLRQRFGVTTLRAQQAEVVTHLLAGRRVTFVAPTGHGKSLCYQALAASPWSRGVVLIFQPLKALMQEQVERARGFGLRAALLNSDLDTDEQRVVLKSGTDGDLDLIFLSPERQGNAMWHEHIGQMEIKGVVIDEAHCISQWGHDFRPWYRRLVETVVNIGIRTPVLAVTATAPIDVVNDIIGQIRPDDGTVAVVERLGSHRSNIALSCWPVQGFAARLAALLHMSRASHAAPGIAYLLTKDETEMAAAFLQQSSVPAAAYHAGMDAQQRANVLDSWRSGAVSVVCATSALGMGLDRADVRWIAHIGLPDSLLRYVQEIGRAGRDGQPAYAIAVHDPETRLVYEAFLRSSSPPPQDFKAVADALRAGCTTRTQIVERCDIPENTVQHILDEFGRRKWCSRTDGTPLQYTWIATDSSGVPDGLEVAIAVRGRFLAGALAYATATECRSVALARAMGDDTLPPPCAQCDVCRPVAMPDLTRLTAEARGQLARFCPPINAARGSFEAGLALSRYGLGRIGEGIKGAKYFGQAVPTDLVSFALAQISSAAGPYAGISFDAVVSVPSATSDIVATFAKALAAQLRVPWIELTKVRTTDPQKSFRSKQRKARNIQGALSLPVGVGAPPRVLLVDDVYDSGASFREAGRVLRPSTVYPLALARAKHSDDA